MIQIAIDQNRREFIPGETIGGKLSWREIKSESERIEVRLIWFTTGKGDRDVQVVEQKTIERPNTTGEYEFVFAAPDRPYSFSGKLISLTWAIEAVVFPKMDSGKTEICISADGREIELYQESTDS